MEGGLPHQAPKKKVISAPVPITEAVHAFRERCLIESEKMP